MQFACVRGGWGVEGGGRGVGGWGGEGLGGWGVGGLGGGGGRGETREPTPIECK